MTNLYGRTELIGELSARAHPVVVITGDQGVGKSSVLAASRVAVSEGNLIAESIARLPHRTGGLQASIVAQLSSIAKQIVSNQSHIEKLKASITNRTLAAIGSRRKEFLLALTRELATVVKERIGSEVGQSLNEFFASAAADGGESVLREINSRVDNDALSAIVDLSAAIAELKPGASVCFFFENAQNLSDEDLRQLADLPPMLPREICIFVEHQDSHQNHRKRINILRSGRVKEFSLSGLSEPQVAEWCTAAGIDRSLHHRIFTVTRGYPLFIDDAIASAVSHRRIPDFSAHENFRMSTLENLDDLTPEDAAAARQLSAFIDPPDTGLIIEILGSDISLARWEGVRARLQRAKIFTITPGRDPWFHEIRRRYIWESISPTLRRHVANSAVDFVIDQFRTTGDPEILINLAHLGPMSHQVENDEQAHHLATASIHEIALACALLELAEPTAGGPSPDITSASGASVFAYCRESFMPDVDAVSALQQLVRAGVVVQAENEHSAVLVPRISDLSYYVLMARAGSELRRFPLFRIASHVFDLVIRPRATSFVAGTYGIGKPRLGTVLREVLGKHRAQLAHQGIGTPQYIDAVFIRALVERQPFYALMTFPDSQQASDLYASISRLQTEDTSFSFVMQRAVQLPVTKLRSKRFVAALDRLHFRAGGNRSLSRLEEAIFKANLFRCIRANLSTIERVAYYLEENLSYAVSEGSGNGTTVIEIVGRGDGVIQLPNDFSFSYTGAYRWAELHNQLGLKEGESTGIVSFGGGTSRLSPGHHIASLVNSCREFNQSQKSVRIEVSQENLQKALADALRDTYFDVEALAAVLSDYGSVAMAPVRNLLGIFIQGEEGRRLAWDKSEALWLSVPEESVAYDTVIVKLVEVEDIPAPTEAFGEAFADEIAQVPDLASGVRDWRACLGVADPHFLLTRMLGHDESEIIFMR